MKRTLVKCFILLSEVTSRPVPNAVRRLLSEEEFRALQEQETELTKALQAERPDAVRMPDSLRSELDRNCRRQRPESRPLAWLALKPAWALPACALLAIGLTVFIFPQDEAVDSKGEAVTRMPASDTASEAPASPADPLRFAPVIATSVTDDALLNPLASEKKRLAADVTNAVQFVAESFLPSEYVLDIGASMQAVHQRFMKSM
jgi:hypothetical protein